MASFFGSTIFTISMPVFVATNAFDPSIVIAIAIAAELVENAVKGY